MAIKSLLFFHGWSNSSQLKVSGVGWKMRKPSWIRHLLRGWTVSFKSVTQWMTRSGQIIAGPSPRPISPKWWQKSTGNPPISGFRLGGWNMIPIWPDRMYFLLGGLPAGNSIPVSCDRTEGVVGMPTSVKTVGRNNLNSHLFEGFSPWKPSPNQSTCDGVLPGPK